MYIQLNECEALPASAQMTIRSSGYFVYTVEFAWNGKCKLFSEDGHSARIFQNITSIKDCFRHLAMEEANLIHLSAYDEMVGQAPSEGNELTVAVKLKTIY